MAGPVETFKAWPTWGKVMTIAVALLVVAGIANAAEDNGKSTPSVQVAAEASTTTLATTTTMVTTTLPPTTTTVAPTTTRAPVTTAAPTTVPSDCNPNYTPCVPNASDVDCAGGSGNGPAYVQGPVRVIGVDVYGLDTDHDGIGCE